MSIASAAKRFAYRILIAGSGAAVAGAPGARAHTVSIGYAFTGPGAVTLWYGSYHADATFNEANVQLVGPQFNQTIVYTLISSVKPAGLIDGVNNFYSNTAGTALVGTPQIVASTDGSGGSFNPATQSILNWQGAIFTGLKPGTYTFTYNPLSLPTVEWHPINDVIRTNSFTLTVRDVLGIDSFAFFGLNRNQRAVGIGLDNAIYGGAYNQAFYNRSALPASAIPTALTRLSGEVATGAGRASFQMLNPFLALMLDPFVMGRGGPGDGFGAGWGGAWGAPSGGPGGGLGPAGAGNGPGNGMGNGSWGDWGWPPGNGSPNDPSRPDAAATSPPPGQPLRQWFDHSWSIWASAYGGSSRVSGDPTAIGSHDVRTRAGGIVSGMDYRVAPGTVVGFAVAGGKSTWGLAEGLGTGESNVFQVGAYGSTRLDAAYLSASFAYAAHGMTTDRTVTIFNSDRLRGSFVTQSFGARVEGGYRVDLQGLRVTPYGALQIEGFRAPSYGETVVAGASDYALRYDGRTASTTRAELGTWLDTRLRLDIGGELILRTRLAWVHDWAGEQIIGASFPALPGANFTVIGAPVAPNSALTSFGAEWRLTSGLSVIGKFDAEFAPHATTYVGTGTVRYTW